MVKKYEDLLYPVVVKAKKANFKTSLAYGFTQMIQYVVIAAMFYLGGLLIEYSGKDPDTGRSYIDPSDVFASLFALTFGAS